MIYNNILSVENFNGLRSPFQIRNPETVGDRTSKKLPRTQIGVKLDPRQVGEDIFGLVTKDVERVNFGWDG